MIAKIVAGSPQNDFARLYQHDPEEFLIGVDIGSEVIVRMGLRLDVAIGDFDSQNLDFACIRSHAKELLSYPTEKDETDLELALLYLRKHHISDGIIYNATGGRLDHFMTVLRLLERFSDLKLILTDSVNEIRLLPEGETKLFQNDFRYLSFFPSGTCRITLEGFKYPLEDRLIDEKDTYLVSNEIIRDPAMVKVSSGNVLLVRSK